MGIEDHTIYLINDLGQYEVLNQDLSGLDLAEDIKEVPTELEAIVSQIQLLTESQQIPPVPQPWLPPLKERMTLQELEPIQPKEVWEQKKPVSVLLGMADIPQAQKQEPVSVNPCPRMGISCSTEVLVRGRQPSCRVLPWTWLASSVPKMSRST